MKINSLFFILIAFTHFTYSQIPSKIQDTAVVNQLTDLGKKAMNAGRFDSALYYVSRSLKISSDLSFTKGTANTYHLLGKIYQRKHDLDRAFNYFEMALELYSRVGDAKGMGITNNSMALTYFHKGNYPKALEHHYKALKEIEKIRDTSLLSITYNNIGAIQKEQNHLARALDFYTKSLSLMRSIHDTSRMGNVLGNIGTIYDEQLNYKKAFEYYAEALAIAQHTQNKDLEAKMYANISGAETHINPKMALEHQLKALEIRKELGDEEGLAPLIYNVGTLYFKLKNNAMALEYTHKANDMAKRLNLLKSIKESEWMLKEIYDSEKKFDKSYIHFQNYIAARDTLYNEENTEKLLRTEMNYEYEKKEFIAKQEQMKRDAEALAKHKRQQIIIWTISFFLILLAVIAILVIRQFRYKNKEREMQLEQKLLRSQMNPHFIFNSLQAIQNFILQRNEKDAVRYLGSFAAITRSVLENSRLELIPVRKELSLLENYLQLQKLRFGDKFTYRIHVDENLEIDELLIPPMLSQPFIENALEHGMSSISEGGLIDIQFSVEHGKLIMEIKDNGNGIAGSKNLYVNHTSLATTITRERIVLMNKKSKLKTLFDIAEAYPNEIRKGVKVRFSIPIEPV